MGTNEYRLVLFFVAAAAGLGACSEVAGLDENDSSADGDAIVSSDNLEAEIEDADGDGKADSDDPCPNDNPDDSDGDGVCDSEDLCPWQDDAVYWNGVDCVLPLPRECVGENVVLDEATGLCWQDPEESDRVIHSEATSYCDDLELEGFDDWRLPTISELRTIVQNCPISEPGSACGLTDSCLDYAACGSDCDYCSYLLAGYLDENLSALKRTHVLWSSSVDPQTSNAYTVEFYTAFIRSESITADEKVRCVRDSGIPCDDMDTDGTCDYAQ